MTASRGLRFRSNRLSEADNRYVPDKSPLRASAEIYRKTQNRGRRES